jgi:mRNA interferase MazF
MPHYSKGDVVLVKYPFTDHSNYKVRPAVVISSPGQNYNDFFVVPLTSRSSNLSTHEFVLEDWKSAGLNVPSAVKRGIALLDGDVVLKSTGSLSAFDFEQLKIRLRAWLDFE